MLVMFSIYLSSLFSITNFEVISKFLEVKITTLNSFDKSFINSNALSLIGGIYLSLKFPLYVFNTPSKSISIVFFDLSLLYPL